MAQMTANDLATEVANEIYEGARAYDGPRWEIVDESERAVRFTVPAPSAKGKSPKRLQKDEMSFDFQVGSAERYSYVASDGWSRSVAVLGVYHISLQVENGVYTGEAVVWERSCDYDL